MTSKRSPVRAKMAPAPRVVPRFEQIGPAEHRNLAEVDARDVGAVDRATEIVWNSVRALYATGTMPAMTLCVRRHGEVVIDRSIGYARGRGPGDAPDAPVEVALPTTPFCLFSASKAVTAMLIHLLDERGVLHIDDRVVEYIPEFGRHGKQWVTLRHVLTHRAGIPTVPDAGARVDAIMNPDSVLELLCDAKLTSRPGRRLAYHAITGGFVLGEVVRRVTGKTIRELLADTFTTPFGLDWFNYGVAPEHVGKVARNYITGPKPPPIADMIIEKALGVPLARAVEISNDTPYLTSIVPAGNLVATANEASLFFDLLVQNGTIGDRHVFEGRTIRRATNESSWLELDFTLGLPVRYGLGLMLGMPYVSLFGPDTARAYGHLGFMNVLAWADPERGLSAALLTSGKPFISTHLIALYRVLGAISSSFPKLA